MNFNILNEPIPLKTDKDGVVRVGKTRVTLDTIVTTFNDGATPEEIMYQFPTLNLADIYSVISYYLRQQKKIDAYLSHRKHLSKQIREQNQARFDMDGVRNRLMLRVNK
ncbi:DUF433 domain-containing protein [Candidatus Magnetomoraceae bacterium gMMP-15]